MYWLKIFLVSLIMVGVTLWTLVKCIWRWGDPNLMAEWAHLWGDLALPVLGIKVKVHGYHNMLDYQPSVYMFNHQSGVDLMTIGKVAPINTVPIAKKEIAWIPVMGWIFMASRCILIDRKNRKRAHDSIALAAKRMREEKLSVGISPEGTRNGVSDEMLPFKKGGFHLALDAGVPIIPVISGPLKPLFDHKKRHSVPGTLEIHCLPPYFTAGKTHADLDQMVAEVRKIMVDCYESLKSRSQ